ncbi:hypothetical protein POM88_020473 [Heracleum sosnowskyi]|uniref:HAT C-terminal dimerisation domain-containing protein n=1 Tax=Heracleum sosnowskyi TaxID=360622 RepID=A0AAD8IE62_9APIA|nr:hypothetical protein POM88_020473 [Heracleum sosnowskyi]
MVARIIIKVESVLHRMYASYAVGVDGVSTKDGTGDSLPKTVTKEKRQRRLLENYLQQQQQMETTEKKNDIDVYLAEEALNPMTDKFDILLWWKENAGRGNMEKQFHAGSGGSSYFKDAGMQSRLLVVLNFLVKYSN